MINKVLISQISSILYPVDTLECQVHKILANFVIGHIRVCI